MPARKKDSEVIGKQFTMQDGEKLTIVNYFGCNNVYVEFEDGTRKMTFMTQIMKGNVINPSKPKQKGSNNFDKTSYCNVGYLGCGPFNTKMQVYTVWRNMILRCYGQKTQETRQTYKQCQVCEDWHNFQNFAKWYVQNKVEDWFLDKDILQKGNKLYAPEYCCFVPREINSLFTKTNALRGDLPIGVSYNKQTCKYMSCIHKFDKNYHLGLFETIDEAFQKYKEEKEEYIKYVADKWKDKLKPEVYQAMYNYQVEITD